MKRRLNREGTRGRTARTLLWFAVILFSLCAQLVAQVDERDEGSEAAAPKSRATKKDAPKSKLTKKERHQLPTTIKSFLGHDFARVGYVISPGESLDLKWENNEKQRWATPVKWVLLSYTGITLREGTANLEVAPGKSGGFTIALPADLATGHYVVKCDYAKQVGDLQPKRPQYYHFEYRAAKPDPQLNLTVLALIENGDAEGWVRAITGPYADYVQVISDWPQGKEDKVDVVLMLGEIFAKSDPRCSRLEQYLSDGGRLLVFGRPSAALAKLLPVEFDAKSLWRNEPQRLVPESGELWSGFDPGKSVRHYAVAAKALADSRVLAKWQDGSPAVVERCLGKGSVVYVGAGSGEAWQKNPSLDGCDEMLLRLMFYLAKGEKSVAPALRRAGQWHESGLKTQRDLAQWVLADSKQAVPQNYSLPSESNFGRYGWMPAWIGAHGKFTEGTLAEELDGNGTVSCSLDPKDDLSILFDGHKFSDAPIKEVDLNWICKSIHRQSGAVGDLRMTHTSTSPGVLWEGQSRKVLVHYPKATHVAYCGEGSKMFVGAQGQEIPAASLAENWIVLFNADKKARDVPRLPRRLHPRGTGAALSSVIPSIARKWAGASMARCTWSIGFGTSSFRRIGRRSPSNWRRCLRWRPWSGRSALRSNCLKVWWTASSPQSAARSRRSQQATPSTS